MGILLLADGVYPHAVRYASPAALRLLGRSWSEVQAIGADCLGSMSHQSCCRAGIADWPPSHRTRVEYPGGGGIELETSAAVGTVDGERLLVVLLVEPARRPPSAERNRLVEDPFWDLIDGAPDAVLITDETSILYANPVAAELFGEVSGANLVGRDPRSFVHPEDVSRFEQRAYAVLHERSRLATTEYRVVTADGDQAILESSSRAIEYRGQRAILVWARDVTERKQIEAQLLQADRLSALGMLAGGMAHAINNPLTYVLLNLDDVARRLGEVVAGRSPLSEALARLREAHQGAERIAGTVRQMRTFARPEDSRQGPIDLRRVIENVVAVVGNEIRHRGQLLTDLQPVPAVTGSASRLEHVFLNLLVHVARDLPEDDPHGEVRIVVGPHGTDQVLVEVSDYGPGIEPAVLDRLFDPFVPGDEPTEPVGLGLSVCHTIVSSLGGTITVESEVGRGSTYRVILPVDTSFQEVPRSSVRPGSVFSQIPLRRARVMVVDDDPGVVSGLRLMLEDDHDVTSVSSGREALRMLVREDSYDIVFCDLMMPELSGKDLFEAIQLNCPGREQRLVFMTGGAFTPEAARFLEQVPNARIEKPFDMESIRNLLHLAVLDRSRAIGTAGHQSASGEPS